MVFEVDFGEPFAGYVHEVFPDSDRGTIIVQEFTSTEDGQYFIQRLEGIPDRIRQGANPDILPSQIDHMLAIVRRDGKCSVYINELAIHAPVQVTRSVQAGQPVMKEDIADLDRIELGVPVPDDAGVVFVFSTGWRKGLFFDLSPVGGPTPTPRDYDLESRLGRHYLYVLFQERFSISEEEWGILIAAKWFPFIGLNDRTIRDIISYVRSGDDPDQVIDMVVSEVKKKASGWLESWKKHELIGPHIEIMERAVERFREDDYMSCTGLLVPRIEGILRNYHQASGAKTKFSAQNLVQAAASTTAKQDRKLLFFPLRFSEYLKEGYLATFDSAALDSDVSRNSVAHGVADPAKFDAKAAVTNLLLVSQLYYFLEG